MIWNHNSQVHIVILRNKNIEKDVIIDSEIDSLVQLSSGTYAVKMKHSETVKRIQIDFSS